MAVNFRQYILRGWKNSRSPVWTGPLSPWSYDIVSSIGKATMATFSYIHTYITPGRDFYAHYRIWREYRIIELPEFAMLK